jgi:hypothetical protein
MINLHQLYNHYLNTDKKHDLVNEKVVSYGWCDNGKDLTGYYVLTESHELRYTMEGYLDKKMSRKPENTRA